MTMANPTPPIEELRGQLAKVGWTRLVTDYIPEGHEVEEGWRIHDFPDGTHIANFVVSGIEDEDEAKLFVALANAALAAQSVSDEGAWLGDFRCHNCKRVVENVVAAPDRCPDCRCRDFSAVAPAHPIKPVEAVEQMREAGWLIEVEQADGLFYHMSSRLTRDHNEALRFAREVDAKAFADAFITPVANLTGRAPYTRIAEHVWG